MTKKDFELIASVIEYYTYDSSQYNPLVYSLADKLASLYPKFQKDKFLLACGITDWLNDGQGNYILIENRYAIYKDDGCIYDTLHAKDIPQRIFILRDELINKTKKSGIESDVRKCHLCDSICENKYCTNETCSEYE